MRLDRRAFFRVLGGGLALLAGWRKPAVARTRAAEIHRLTRNTRRGALGPRDWRAFFQPARHKAYPERARIALPAAGADAGLPLAEALLAHEARAVASASLSLPQLARLLYFTNGSTGRMGRVHLRAAPSAGALYAGEVYVVAERVEGLPPGVYSYHVREHALVALAQGSQRVRIAAAVERPDAVEDAPAWLLVANVFPRLTRRYRNRGYRYALIDTGHVIENLRLAARSAGFAVASPERFHDDVLGEVLGLDDGIESVCALAAIGGAAPAGGGPLPVARRFDEKWRVGIAEGLRDRPAPERFHDATKLVPGESPPPAASPIAAAAKPRGVPVPLASSRPAPRTAVEGAIRARRSADSFRRTPLDRDDLAFLLASARPEGSRVDLVVVVNRVSDIAPGVYAWDPAARALLPRERGDLAERLRGVCLGQEDAASAAVGVAMIGRLIEATAAGDRGYRDVLVGAGAIGQRLYLAAEATGVAARNLAAFYDDDLNRLLREDGADRAVVHLTMVGPGD